ncbi:MAG: phosphate signaling complex protein PhoU [Myxococcota bacterium]|nr:phosphate signaling complex protein PhoU [Myxococcota bacterium]MDW8363064.1 phosphate signaling complex protein PhoU [Myxococcales bacterium]
MPQHTSHEFEAELRRLKERLLAMGGRCESSIAAAVRALETRNPELASAVERDDRVIDADELAIDELAVRILALRQPVGRDLRFLMTALKVVTDLERIGDEAVNVAERARDLSAAVELPESQALLGPMAAVATRQLRRALDAFVEEDASKAADVLARDDEVDELYGRIVRATLAYMAAHPQNVEAAMRVTSCAKYLERIGDHATNIAEMVVYLVDGVDVRHGGARSRESAGTR